MSKFPAQTSALAKQFLLIPARAARPPSSRPSELLAAPPSTLPLTQAQRSSLSPAHWASVRARRSRLTAAQIRRRPLSLRSVADAVAEAVALVAAEALALRP